MNDLILDFFYSYTKNPDPQYAVMLKGKWGCGKTHFIKQWKNNFDSTDDIDAQITLKPIYISTYGMKSVAEIRTAIDRELNPFFYSKTGKFIKGALKIAGKIAFKTNFDINGDAKEDGSFSATLDSLSLLQTKDDSIKGVKFLIFDDIERSQIDMKELLGFINYFVEHCDCHVVVIGDENHLEETSKKVLQEFKEKTIGREFEIQPDIEEAITYFLNEVPVSDYLKEMRDFIIKCFKCTGYGNLRVLRQCLYDFKEQLDKIPSEFAETVKVENILLKNILASFIAVYAEYNNKDNQELICNWSQKYQFSLSQDKDENRAKMQGIIDKYNSLNKELIYNVFRPELLEAIIRHITTGEPFASFLVSVVGNEHKELKPWEKLPSFYDMEQQEFEDTCRNTVNAILNNEIQDGYQLGYIISYLSYFDAIGIYYFIMAHISLIKVQMTKMVNSLESLEELFLLKGRFFAGCNSLYTEGTKIPIKDDIGQYFLKILETKISHLSDSMQIALRKLSEETVEDLIIIDGTSYPDRSSTYELRAIFANENPERLFESICRLSNKGKNTFTQFLSYHYKFEYNYQNIGNRYEADLPCLSRLQKLVNGKLTMPRGTDWLSFEKLNNALLRAIQRCKGESNV